MVNIELSTPAGLQQPWNNFDIRHTVAVDGPATILLLIMCPGHLPTGISLSLVSQDCGVGSLPLHVTLNLD